MKLQLNKLMAGLVMAGGAVALVGCGDGGSPTLGASSNLTKTIKAGDTVAIQGAQTIAKAFGETGANFPLSSAIVFDANVTPGANSTAVPPIPANGTLNLNPSTNAAAIADFKITAPNTTKTVEGIVLPGSCNFQVTGPIDTAQLLDGYVVGQIYRIGTCAFTVPTATVNALVNTPVTLTPTLTLGNTTLPASRTITITVNDNGSVTAQVPVETTTVVNGVPTTTITFTPVTVAPAGSVSLTTGG